MIVLAAITNLSYSTTLYAFSILLGESAAAGGFDRAHLSRVTKELRTMFRALNAATSTPSRASQQQRPARAERPSPRAPYDRSPAVRPLTEKPEDHPGVRRNRAARLLDARLQGALGSVERAASPRGDEWRAIADRIWQISPRPCSYLGKPRTSRSTTVVGRGSRGDRGTCL